MELSPNRFPSVSMHSATHPNVPMENLGRTIVPPASSTRVSSMAQSLTLKYTVVPRLREDGLVQGHGAGDVPHVPIECVFRGFRSIVSDLSNHAFRNKSISHFG